nr:MAG TPA: hypothetical protein [Caudoviricetes sp.]
MEVFYTSPFIFLKIKQFFKKWRKTTSENRF